MTNHAPFEIATDAETGSRLASNGTALLKLDGPEGRVFRRRGIQFMGDSVQGAVEWVVAELDGVRVYFDGKTVRVSRDDIAPNISL